MPLYIHIIAYIGDSLCVSMLQYIETYLYMSTLHVFSTAYRDVSLLAYITVYIDSS
jgi:hypothetical protein